MASHDIIVIGASAGGIEALTQLVRTLPQNFPGSLFVVLHLSPDNPSLLPRILTRAGALEASHPEDGEQFRPGHIYVAPPDLHLLIEENYVRLVRGPKENRHRPAIDPLFRSAARSYGVRVVGVVLSGMLDDGTAGLLAIKRCGGLAIVQHPEEALYPSMPQSALEHVKVDYCLPVREIGPKLISLMQEPELQAVVPSPDATLEKETRSVEMKIDHFNEQEHVGTPSVFGCPECGGVLWEIKDGDFLRFRCRVGHALSAESVLAEQSESVDKALWNALKTLEEKASLSARLARQAQERGNSYMEQHFLAQMQEAEENAESLRALLLASHKNKTAGLHIKSAPLASEEG